MGAAICPWCGQHLDASRPGVFCSGCGQRLPSPSGSTALREDSSVSAAKANGEPSRVLPLSEDAGGLAPALEDEDNRSAISQILKPPRGPGEIGWLSDFRILAVLGVGGMGVVFKAEDPVLGRKVALKVLLPSVAAKAINRQRFLREARATAALRHPHIVTVYNAGEANGVPFLIMEFLEGELLEDRLRRSGRLSTAEIVRIGRETADGLAAAHANGLVHRDVKPANLWLEQDAGRVKILDFGLARVAAEDATLTVAGTILGTPAFMSPEQARGREVDARTDLFSLGSVLYFMATGERPFKGSDTLAVLTALATETPRPIHSLNPGTPPALANLVTALLAKDPDDRPASARAVREALADIQRGEARGDILGLGEAPMRLQEEGVAGPLLSLAPTLEAPVLEDPAEFNSPSSTEFESPFKLPHLPPDRLGELVGHTLGRFEVGPVIGQGHHGLVFRGSDSDSEEIVALKVLSPEFPQNDAEIDRFSGVMKTWLTLRHPNLVGVRAAGKTGPYCWIALEYVEGESLAQILERSGAGRPLDWKRAFRVATDICQALQFTSRKRLIHSNITPRNILVRQTDGRVKLNDLLLLKVVRGSVLCDSTLERKIAAEVLYLSPEQVDGGNTFMDHLCDLYSLGVILYLLVTGRPPFQGKSMEETCEKILREAPIRPGTYQKGLPREFERTILRMLAKRQEERYQSPAELLADLASIAGLYKIVD